MAEMAKFSMRLSDSDRRALEEIAEHHQRNHADMIRFLIRAERRRLSTPAPAPVAQPSAPAVDDFDIVDD